MVIGTPDLMAPEQAAGRTAQIGAHTDVYGLGVTLYVKLTGRRPFARPSLVATLQAVLGEHPPLPRAIDPSIPRALQAIVLRCMGKNPRERYRSMAALAAALGEFLDGQDNDAAPGAGDADPAADAGGGCTRHISQMAGAPLRVLFSLLLLWRTPARISAMPQLLNCPLGTKRHN